MSEQTPSLPVYEVEELSLEQVILELASEEEKYATQYQAATSLFLQLCA